MNYLYRSIVFFILAVMVIVRSGSGAETPRDDEQTKKTAARFTTNANGTVLDTKTGIMWSTDANLGKLPLPFRSADQYILNMNRGIVPNAGHTNWRLPTITELATLIDKNQSYPALPADHPFTNVQNDFYWSSSKGTDIVDYVTTLDLATGNRVNDRSSSCTFRFLWPVRNTWQESDSRLGILFTAGINKYGQLGDSAESHASFIPLSQLGNVVKIAAGFQHAMALNADGTVWVWGDNRESQSGVKGAEIRTPTMVPDLREIIDIAAGSSHSVALKADGTVWVWGRNSQGQLGIGNAPNSPVPVRVNELSQVARVFAGMNQTFAVKSDGTVWFWGENGSGSAMSRVPTRVPGLAKIKKIAAGVNHTLVLKTDGTVAGWGENKSGQLGDGTLSSTFIPVPVKDLSQVVDIAAGFDHSLALKADGSVWVWGSNKFNQLGIDAASSVTTPRVLEGLNKSVKIAAGTYHSLALSQDGVVSIWGEDVDSMGRKPHPYPVTYVRNVFDMAGGNHFSLLLSESTAR